MFGMPSGAEWLIVLLLVLIVFGAGKLPQVGRQLGSAISEFKDTVRPKDEEEDAEPKNEKKEDKDNQDPPAAANG
jgi:sec-independent protein translocase protein TatA